MNDQQQTLIDDQQVSNRDLLSSALSVVAWTAVVVMLILVELGYLSDIFSDRTDGDRHQGTTTFHSAESSSARQAMHATASPVNTTSEAQASRAVDTDPSGLYTYRNVDGETRLRVLGSHWIAVTMLRTGFGDEYDASQAMTSSGIVEGSMLYDETGYVQVGRLRRIGANVWVAELAVGGGSMYLRRL